MFSVNQCSCDGINAGEDSSAYEDSRSFCLVSRWCDCYLLQKWSEWRKRLSPMPSRVPAKTANNNGNFPKKVKNKYFPPFSWPLLHALLSLLLH